MLYVIATPIGNLEEMSPRACRILAEVPLIACEAIAATRRLLSAKGIACPRLISYRDDSRARSERELLEHLQSGQSAALVSEAGTPCISDPGWQLLAQCQRLSIKVEAVAGPSALVAALSVAGVDCKEFRFVGFPPHKARDRREFLQRHLTHPETLVFFESPHRIQECLGDLLGIAGPDQEVVLVRELTKLHEEVVRGTLARLAQQAQQRGEYVVVVPARACPEPDAQAASTQLSAKVAFLQEAGLSSKQIVEFLSKIEDYPRNAVYRLTQS